MLEHTLGRLPQAQPAYLALVVRRARLAHAEVGCDSHGRGAADEAAGGSEGKVDVELWWATWGVSKGGAARGGEIGPAGEVMNKLVEEELRKRSKRSLGREACEEKKRACVQAHAREAA